MVDLAKLDELIARVEKAEGGDRELDRQIAWAMLPDDERKIFDGVQHYPTIWFAVEGQGYQPLDRCDAVIGPLTGSIDAALGLLDRTLKVYSITLTIDPSGNGAQITWWPNGLGDGQWIMADEVSAYPPLAIILALLKALREASHDH